MRRHIVSIFAVVGVLLACTAFALVQQGGISSGEAARPAEPQTILFIGNSFTLGMHSTVRKWRPESVSDLSGKQQGGVPALFKSFTEQSGLDYTVSFDAEAGKSLAFHYENCRKRFDHRWDVVVLQEYSQLDSKRPGDMANYLRDTARLTALFKAHDRFTQVWLMPTWSRADATYSPKGKWHGQSIDKMALDLRAAADAARRATSGITGIIPVGEGWNRAFSSGVADADPYDGLTKGQVNLWAADNHHGSLAGYYLTALTVFGSITKVDPRSLGADEFAASDLGLDPKLAVVLQRVAAEQLLANGVDFRSGGITSR